MKKYRSIAVLGAALLSLTAGFQTHAAGEQVVEKGVYGNRIVTFVSGLDASGEMEALIGKKSCSGVSAVSMNDSGMAVKTWILIDNSLSIPTASRKAIRDDLNELIASRKDNEYYALGTIGENVDILLDFTNDYAQLKSSLDALEYQDQETYLTDALYDFLSSDAFVDDSNALERILIVSDGVDNKEIGYTKEELSELLKENAWLIDTIGVYNKKKSNSENLENMFAIARQTGGTTFLLDDLDGGADLAASLAQDWDLTVVSVDIPEAAMDGSVQSLSLKPAGEDAAVISVDNLRMPSAAENVQAEPVQDKPVEENTVTETDADGLLAKIKENPLAWGAVGLILLGILIAIIVLFVRLLKKKEDPFPMESGPIPQPEPVPWNENTVVADDGLTESDNTMILPTGGAGGYRITLTDISNPGRIIQKNIDRTALLGRNEACDICFREDSTVSSFQCELTVKGDALYLLNLSTTNATRINGEPVRSAAWLYDMPKIKRISDIPVHDGSLCGTQLYNGAVIKMGKVEMRCNFSRIR